MKTIWKTVDWCSDYQVSNKGKVRSFKKGIALIMKGSKSLYGYPRLNLCESGKVTTVFIHRLVANAFIGICPEGLQVNHKNGIKDDNRVMNLEYVTDLENKHHAHRMGLYKPPPGKTTLQFAMDGTFIAEHVSMCGVARQLGLNYRCISACCLGRTKSSGGFIWRYADEYSG